MKRRQASKIYRRVMQHAEPLVRLGWRGRLAAVRAAADCGYKQATFHRACDVLRRPPRCQLPEQTERMRRVVNSLWFAAMKGDE